MGEVEGDTEISKPLTVDFILIYFIYLFLLKKQSAGENLQYYHSEI